MNSTFALTFYILLLFFILFPSLLRVSCIENNDYEWNSFSFFMCDCVWHFTFFNLCMGLRAFLTVLLQFLLLLWLLLHLPLFASKNSFAMKPKENKIKGGKNVRDKINDRMAVNSTMNKQTNKPTNKKLSKHWNTL